MSLLVHHDGGPAVLELPLALNRWTSRGSTDVPRDQAACTILVLDPPGWPKSSPLSACDEGDDVGSFQRRDDCRPRLDRIPFQAGTRLGRLVLFCPALQLSCLSVSVGFHSARLLVFLAVVAVISISAVRLLSFLSVCLPVIAPPPECPASCASKLP